jgi:hypothetical protein
MIIESSGVLSRGILRGHGSKRDVSARETGLVLLECILEYVNMSTTTRT